MKVEISLSVFCSFLELLEFVVELTKLFLADWGITHYVFGVDVSFVGFLFNEDSLLCFEYSQFIFFKFSLLRLSLVFNALDLSFHISISFHQLLIFCFISFKHQIKLIDFSLELKLLFLTKLFLHVSEVHILNTWGCTTLSSASLSFL